MQIQRRRPTVVRTIIFINIIVFLMWHFSNQIDPQFMADNFLISWSALMDGRYWVLISSVFSHNMFWHILINMLVLSSFGPVLEMVLGSRSFILFYLCAGLVGSVGHSLVSAFILHTPDLPALGASGAIAGLVLVYSLMFPKQRILIFGLIPIPALWGAFLFIGLDAWGVVAQAQGGGLPIGHGAHLGGAFAGILYFFLILRRRRKTGPSIG